MVKEKSLTSYYDVRVNLAASFYDTVDIWKTSKQANTQTKQDNKKKDYFQTFCDTNFTYEVMHGYYLYFDIC